MDELAGVRLAETIMEIHPPTVAQGRAMLSAFRCSKDYRGREKGTTGRPGRGVVDIS